jgi:hypothetical protein
MFVHPTTALLIAAERRSDAERRIRRPSLDRRTVRLAPLATRPDRD